MIVDFNARLLQREVDALLAAAVAVGVGGQVTVTTGGRSPRPYRVDRILLDDRGAPCETWLSSASPRGWLDRYLGRTRIDLLRAGRSGGDVRRTASTLTMRHGRPCHSHFREDVAAPRKQDSIATWRVPRADATDWLQSYAQAS